MGVSTDVATVIRTALDQSKFSFFQRSFSDDDGYRVDEFLVRYSYDKRAKTEIDYLLSLMTYADGAKILAFLVQTPTFTIMIGETNCSKHFSNIFHGFATPRSSCEARTLSSRRGPKHITR